LNADGVLTNLFGSATNSTPPASLRGAWDTVSFIPMACSETREIDADLLNQCLLAEER
jgi:hypothetical protein